MVFRKHFEKMKYENEMVLTDREVDYSLFGASYFEEWGKFWSEKGIDHGMRIGLLLNRNQCMMPLLLSLEDMVCDIHFLNQSLESQYVRENRGRFHCLLTDEAVECPEAVWHKEFHFMGVPFHLYGFAGDTVRGPEGGKRYFYYTSGSTGEPKACGAGEENIYWEGLAMMGGLELQKSDRILSLVPCSHKFGQSVVCIAAALAGCKVMYLNGIQTPAGIMKYMQQEKYDAVVLPPMYLELLCGDSAMPVQNCRYICGGAPLGEKAKGSGRKIINVYGSTETGVIAIRSMDKGKYYAGKAVREVEVRCGTQFDTLENRNTYRIEVRSPYTYGGHEKGEYVPTGDYGWLQGDDIYVCGREDNIINVNGMKVAAAEIEHVLLRHPAVKEARVVKECEDGREYAHGYIVGDGSGGLDVEEVFRFCMEHLQPYKVPKKMDVVDKFHYTEMGKRTRI